MLYLYLSIYIYIYIYIYTYIYIYMYIYMYIYIYVYIYIYIYRTMNFVFRGVGSFASRSTIRVKVRTHKIDFRWVRWLVVGVIALCKGLGYTPRPARPKQGRRQGPRPHGTAGIYLYIYIYTSRSIYIHIYIN